jgi:hypothetical protein
MDCRATGDDQYLYYTEFKRRDKGIKQVIPLSSAPFLPRKSQSSCHILFRGTILEVKQHHKIDK